MRRCSGCRELVTDDGYGELVHAETNKYLCAAEHIEGGAVSVAS